MKDVGMPVGDALLNLGRRVRKGSGAVPGCSCAISTLTRVKKVTATLHISYIASLQTHVDSRANLERGLT